MICNERASKTATTKYMTIHLSSTVQLEALWRNRVCKPKDGFTQTPNEKFMERIWAFKRINYPLGSKALKYSSFLVDLNISYVV